MKNKILKGIIIIASASMLISGCTGATSEEELKQKIMEDIESSVEVEDPSEVQVVNNNYSNFVKYGNKIFFKATDGESKDRIVLYGKFREDDQDSNTLFEYDINKKEINFVCKTNGYGNMAISDGYIFFEDTDVEENTENKFISVMNLSNYSIDNIQDQKLLGADKMGMYVCTVTDSVSDKTLYVYHGKKLMCRKTIPNYVDFVGMDQNAVYYRSINSENGEYYLSQLNNITGDVLDIGKLPIDADKEIETIPRVDQFDSDETGVYLAYGFYNKKGDYIKGYYVKGEIGKENSVSPTFLKNKDNDIKTPAFYVKKGKMKKANGVPLSAGVDKNGNIGYYNESGNFVSALSGYNDINSVSNENIVEIAEYVDGTIFFVKDTRVRAPEADDVGRQAFKRKAQSISIIGEDKTEYSIHNIMFD